MATRARFFSTVLTLAILMGCQSTPKIAEQPDPHSAQYRVSNTAFDRFSLAAPAELSQYKAIYFEPLDVTRLEIDTRRLDLGNRSWPLTDEDKSKMAEYFADSVASAFKNSALPLASGPGEHVLTASVALEKFTPTAAKDDFRNRMPSTEIFTYNVGDLKMTGTLKDSTSGTVLGSIEDTQSVGDTLYLEKNNRTSNTWKLKRTFNQWTDELVTALNALMSPPRK